MKLKKCKVCKKEFKQFNSTQKVCGWQCAVTLGKKIEAKKDEEAKKNARKELKERHDTLYPEKKRKVLQSNINKLARMIDAHFSYPCIDCGSNYTGQIDAAHFKGVGANSTLRYNLHNIHSARAHCNQHNKELHHRNYPKGLADRYGEEYLEMVENLSLQYKELKLLPEEVNEALKKVRKLIREFDTHIKGNDVDGSMARAYFNEQIGIYK